jgi:hypothetical protein
MECSAPNIVGASADAPPRHSSFALKWPLATERKWQSAVSAGVTFERYDMQGARHDGDIHVFGDFKAAWFKDPDGNILHVNSG